MAMSKEARARKNAYDYQFVKDNYKRISVYVPKDLGEDLKAYTKATGETVNSFINRAIRETMKKWSAPARQTSRSDYHESAAGLVLSAIQKLYHFRLQ